MSGSWRVSVDRGRCIGSGMCAGTAPGRFALDGEHRSHPAAEVLPPEEAVLDAAAYCPVEAITLRDASTGRPVYPEGGIA